MVPLRPLTLLPLVFVIAAATGSDLAQAPAAPDPVALVRAASWNELHSPGRNHPVRFRLRKQVEDGSSTTKEIVQTRDGDVARLVAINDQPLPPRRSAEERQRLQMLLEHPELQQRRHRQEQADSGRSDKMIRLLPDAFLYDYRGMIATADGPAWRLTFEPNSRFIPPDREAEVYHGMAGELWINARDTRIAEMDAHLVSDVDFGWGVIGRLFRGGTIQVIQRNVGTEEEAHWESTHLALHLTGKVLMLHTITFKTTEDSTDFRPVPPGMSYQDAIHLLERLQD
jgi:hypothetical protein